MGVVDGTFTGSEEIAVFVVVAAPVGRMVRWVVVVGTVV